MKFADVTAIFKRYRVPIVVGAGGLAAYSAYSSAQQRARAAAVVAAAPPAGGSGGADLGQIQGLIGFGGDLALSGQQPVIGLAEGGLSLAGMAVQGARGVAEAALGSATASALTLGDLAGQVVGALPSFAPYAGIQPQSTQPAPIPGPYPAPAPPPTALPAPTFDYAGTRSAFGTLYPSYVHTKAEALAWQARVIANSPTAPNVLAAIRAGTLLR